jgi:hypothetical protein
VKKGAIVTIDNLEKMAMPVTIEYTTASGKTARKKLPVEIWQNNTSWKVLLPTEEEVTKVVIDPDKVLPDANGANNTWTK